VVVAELAAKAEQAPAPIMFEHRAVLLADRDGIVIEELSGHLPQLDVLGFNTDLTGNGTNILDFPPAAYSWREIESFRPLIGLLRHAVYKQDSKLVGHVASASARINQRYFPKCHFDRFERLVEQVGALGLQVAHSGPIVGMLFDSHGSGKEEQIQFARAYIAELGFTTTWHFQI
jgi:uncharacterized protein involved in propanediol utilization